MHNFSAVRAWKGKSVDPLRLWRYEEQDMHARATNIIRGLKGVAETMWSTEELRYTPRPDKAQTVECTNRTAVEDASHVPAITEDCQS